MVKMFSCWKGVEMILVKIDKLNSFNYLRYLQQQSLQSLNRYLRIRPQNIEKRLDLRCGVLRKLRIVTVDTQEQSARSKHWIAHIFNSTRLPQPAHRHWMKVIFISLSLPSIQLGRMNYGMDVSGYIMQCDLFRTIIFPFATTSRHHLSIIVGAIFSLLRLSAKMFIFSFATD